MMLSDFERSLPETQRDAFRALLHGHYVTYQRMIDVIYGHRLDGGPDDAEGCVRVVIHKLRKRLSAHGITVERGSYGSGYRLDGASLAKARRLVAGSALPVCTHCGSVRAEA